MPSKPTPPDLDLYDQIDPSTYWDLWDRLAEVSLQSILTFHGACDSTAPATAAQHAAACATELLNQRLTLEAAITAAEEARDEEEEAERAAGKGKATR